jgi:hypothetical protein
VTGDLALIALAVVLPGALILAMLAALAMLVVALARADAAT